MKVLSVWHRLLIYFIRQKNVILKDLTDITYVSGEDIKELASWPKEDVIKVLDRLNAAADISNCPWCILHRDKARHCPDCGYGKRNEWCESPNRSGNYKKIINKLKRSSLIPAFNGLTHLTPVKDLTSDIKLIYTILPHILT